jgi:hypothetical protein
MATSKLIKDSNIIHRFSDVGGEPCTMLTPIVGFSNYPLVSLEEAVEPLISIVHDVKRRASIAKEGFTNSSDDLSPDESASIALYTMEWEPYTSSLYYILNSTMRSEDREELQPWFLYLKLIFTGLSRLPSLCLPVYRTLKLDTEIEYEKYQEGRDIIWWGFSSCTTNKNISQKQHFLTPIGTRTLFIIECFNGKDIGPHSYNKNDQEILLLPATEFRVVRCDRRRDDLHKIYMKQVEPKSVLLEPVISSPLNKTLIKSPAPMNSPASRRASVQRFFQQSFDQMIKD